jgi:hypothetical protein
MHNNYKFGIALVLFSFLGLGCDTSSTNGDRANRSRTAGTDQPTTQQKEGSTADLSQGTGQPGSAASPGLSGERGYQPGDVGSSSTITDQRSDQSTTSAPIPKTDGQS